MIKRLIKYLYHKSRGIDIDYSSNVPLKIKIKERSKEFPISIRNSTVNNISLKKGCRLNNCLCLGEIDLGHFVSIFGPGTVLSAVKGKIIIGNYCSIGQNVAIQESYHNYNNTTSYLIRKNIFKDEDSGDFITKGDIVIGDDVWIGSNSVILSGINIGRGAIIAAGSVVTKSVGAYEIWGGNPARKIKMRFDPRRIRKIEDSQWWLWETSEIFKRKSFFKGS